MLKISAFYQAAKETPVSRHMETRSRAILTFWPSEGSSALSKTSQFYFDSGIYLCCFCFSLICDFFDFGDKSSRMTVALSHKVPQTASNENNLIRPFDTNARLLLCQVQHFIASASSRVADILYKQ